MPRLMVERLPTRLLLHRAAAAVGAVFLCTCGEAESVQERTEIPLRCGVFTEDGQFLELTEKQEVDVILGFQGLVFVNLALETSEVPEVQMRAEVSVDFVRDSRDFSFEDNQVYFEQQPAGNYVATSFRVPFDDRPSTIVGQELLIEVQVFGEEIEGSATCRIVLRDENCIHTPEGNFICSG